MIVETYKTIKLTYRVRFLPWPQCHFDQTSLQKALVIKHEQIDPSKWINIVFTILCHLLFGVPPSPDGNADSGGSREVEACDVKVQVNAPSRRSIGAHLMCLQYWRQRYSTIVDSHFDVTRFQRPNVEILAGNHLKFVVSGQIPQGNCLDFVLVLTFDSQLGVGSKIGTRIFNR